MDILPRGYKQKIHLKDRKIDKRESQKGDSKAGWKRTCMICDNYNFCQKCEDKGKHPEHFILGKGPPMRGHIQKLIYATNMVAVLWAVVLRK
jgi:hypothetical protein